MDYRTHFLWYTYCVSSSKLKRKRLDVDGMRKGRGPQNNKKYLDAEIKSAYTGEIILESGIFMKYME